MTLEIRTPEVRGMKREAVELLLRRYAVASLEGDTSAIVDMWELPALLVSDADVRVIGSRVELEAVAAGTAASYEARGVAETHPEILRTEWLTERIATVEVRWPHVGPSGDELGEEAATYTLRRDERGSLRFRVAVSHGRSRAEP